MQVIPLTGDQLSQIANEMARIKAEHYGRGPVSARAFQSGEVVVCIMKGGLTTVERTLVKGGDEKLVREVRLRFQEQMQENFVGAVEQIVRRRVVGFASQVVFDPDYVFEICVLDDGQLEDEQA